MSDFFEWIQFYEVFADKILTYKDNRKSLDEIVRKLHQVERKLNYLHFENPDWWGHRLIDPFTLLGSFNRGLKDENRRALLQVYATEFDISEQIPSYYYGIPIINGQSSFFNGEHELWSLFEHAIDAADQNEFTSQFEEAFDRAINVKGNGLAYLTIGLFWIRPNMFMPQDKNSRLYIAKHYGIPALRPKCSGSEYINYMKELRAKVDAQDEAATYAQISYVAWKENDISSKKGTDEKRETKEMSDVEEDDTTNSPEGEMLDSYLKTDFLDEVFMDEDKYDHLVDLLETKKNVILQGAPGVGKTFAAQRLAYSMIGSKDDQYLRFIQFHQNYSYEDFVMGYKPAEKGFVLESGVFHEFCKVASEDEGNKYFFIIDEINRGNMSKIFGELLMLIENSYRGDEIRLAYNTELFTVPKNLYIIGMMNTADRSLAMIDYALRRRFSFFEMEPGFSSDGFNKYKDELVVKQSDVQVSEAFTKLIDTVEMVNDEIEDDVTLGKGFCLGHSYFCNLNYLTDSRLKSIVRYDILPMLKEYWFDSKNKYVEWEEEFRRIVKDE